MSYDLIGDIHGYSEPLIELLGTLDYKKSDGVYRHPDRKVIFLGDFIDRGPDQRGVIDIVRPMIDSGAALSVMGNHEFNAIAWSTEDQNQTGAYLRPHSEKNRRQHQAFIDAYADDRHGRHGIIDWFRTLPLWLDLGELRVVHAVWHKPAMQQFEAEHSGPLLSDELLRAASDSGRWEYTELETLLKGIEIPLPGGHSFEDKDGNRREAIRAQWWNEEARTYREMFMGPEEDRQSIPEDPLPADLKLKYPPSEPPVFVGHYWLQGPAAPLSANVACLDYSVAKTGGALVAYRWDGGPGLSADNYVVAERRENN